MTHYSQIEGGAFDVDETLLSNSNTPENGGLHERSRLAAIHKVGRQLGLEPLLHVTQREAYLAFRSSRTHSVAGAVWQTMWEKGLVGSDTMDPENEILKAIVREKDLMHEDILRYEGKEVPGATHFVRALAAAGLGEKMSLASTARFKEIEIFLRDIAGIKELFPDERIISQEKVTHLKPHSEAFDSAFKTLGLPDSARPHVLAMEDDPRGVESAKGAGLYVCAITTRYSREDLATLRIAPDMIVDSFAELESNLGL